MEHGWREDGDEEWEGHKYNRIIQIELNFIKSDFV